MSEPRPTVPQTPIDQSHEDKRHSEPERRPARSEVDDYAPGKRQPGSGRGGFDTEQSEANPGGATGEHSGQGRH